MPTKSTKSMVEIGRSFSRKVNIGNYQTLDFYASAKAEAPIEEMDSTSELLFSFCKKEVEHSIEQYEDEQRNRPPVDGTSLWEKKKQEIYKEDKATGTSEQTIIQ